MKPTFIFPRVIIACGMLAAVLCIPSCSNTNAESSKTESVKAEAPKPGNTDYAIGSPEHVALAETALGHMQKFEFDQWAAMLADDVVYAFPDGDVATRTKLVGKAAVTDWWKNWRKESGVQSMTFQEANFIPLNALKPGKANSPAGNYVICYFSNTMVFKGTSVAVRMNFSIHFNSEDKIDRYVTYYDRTPIIAAMKGKNYLQSSVANK